MVIFHSYVKLPEGSGRIALILMTRDGLLGALKKILQTIVTSFAG